MPYASAKDGARLFFEEAGSGSPLIFIHECAGEDRCWAPQMRFFARYFRPAFPADRDRAHRARRRRGGVPASRPD